MLHCLRMYLPYYSALMSSLVVSGENMLCCIALSASIASAGSELARICNSGTVDPSCRVVQPETGQAEGGIILYLILARQAGFVFVSTYLE